MVKPSRDFPVETLQQSSRSINAIRLIETDSRGAFIGKHSGLLEQVSRNGSTDRRCTSMRAREIFSLRLFFSLSLCLFLTRPTAPVPTIAGPFNFNLII